MLFSSSSKDSLYPDSRSRATMELSPHPNDIRVRSLHISVSWQLVIPIVKDVLLTEVIIRDVRSVCSAELIKVSSSTTRPVDQHVLLQGLSPRPIPAGVVASSEAPENVGEERTKNFKTSPTEEDDVEMKGDGEVSGEPSRDEDDFEKQMCLANEVDKTTFRD